MDERVTEAVSHIDDALEKCHGSAMGWEHATDFVYMDSDSVSKTGPGMLLKGSLSLPEAFVRMFGQVRVKSFMGLFPQINRAWLTIDTRLFLWAYSIDTILSHNSSHGGFPTVQTANSADDFFAYDGFDQVILAVELVHPRPGVFSSDVKYLLAVATSVEVSLLGVTFTGSNCTGDVRLIPTGYSVATDKVLMVKISSSPDGRIFMAGDDGCLHEFVYSGDDPRWMLGLLPSGSKKAFKTVYSSGPLMKYLLGAPLASYFSREDELVDLVIDSSRNSLFTLSQRGMLTVYDMSNREKLRSVRTTSIAHESRNLVSLSIPSTEREYVAIFPVTPKVSASIHLVVVTSYGERIHFSTQLEPRIDSRNQVVRMPDASVSTESPKTLVCVGYRPTPIRHTFGDMRPCIHMAWWNQGCLVMADLKDKESDQLLSVFPDSRFGSRQRNASLPIRSNSVEVVYEYLDIGDEGAGFSIDQTGLEPIRTFAIGEFRGTIHDESISHLRTPFEPPHLFWVLTSRRLHLYERRDPLQQLHDLILSNRGSSEEVRSVFPDHGVDDLCAMSLRLAIANPNLAPTAAQIFYGFKEQSSVSGENQNPNRPGTKDVPSSPPGGTSWNTQMKIEGSERNRPNVSNSFNIGRPAIQWTSNTNFSDVHRGTCLYISQVVYPIWLLFITNNRDPLGYQGLNLPREKIIEIRDQLIGLVSFFDKYNPEHMLNASAHRNRLSSRIEISGNRDGMEDAIHRRMETANAVDAHRIESASIESLKVLSNRCAQALTLLLLLAEQQFHRLVASMSDEFKTSIASMRFRELVTMTEGITVSQALLRALFSCYPAGGYPKMQILQVLRDQCYLYYGSSDESLHQGLALLRGAVMRYKELKARTENTENRAIMPGWRVESIGHHEIVPEAEESIRLDAEKAVQALKQAVDRIFDMKQLFEDLHEIEEFRLLVDVALTIGQEREKKHLDKEAEIAYNAAIEVVYYLIHEVNKTGISDTNEYCKMNRNTDSEQIRKRDMKDTCLRTALTSTSSTFLGKLFGKLAQSSIGEVELLELRSKDVENFLRQQNNSELLWRYYSKHGKYFDAALILWKLADVEEKKRLVERMSNLSNALHNAQAAVRSGDTRAETLVAEVSDYLDVARVQLRMLNELKLWKSESVTRDGDIAKLDDRIMDLSTLYNEFAKRHNLYEGSLDALRCGSYRDDAQVQFLWRMLLERESNAASHMPALLFEKLVSVGKSFYPCNFVFPVKYIVDLFERYAYQKVELTAWANEPRWVSNLMMEIGVPVSDIAASYQQMIENALQRTSAFSDDFEWSDDKALLHIMSATEYCLRKWVGSSSMIGNAVSNIDYHQRGWLSEREKALRATSLCKARLRGMAGSHASALLQSFESLESDLKVQHT